MSIKRRALTPQEVAEKVRRDRETNIFDEVINVSPIARIPAWAWLVGFIGVATRFWGKVRRQG